MPAIDSGTCGICLYFLLLPQGDQKGKGICRYGPPGQSNHRAEPNTDDRRWPTAFTSEWCGQWKKK